MAEHTCFECHKRFDHAPIFDNGETGELAYVVCFDISATVEAAATDTNGD